MIYSTAVQGTAPLRDPQGSPREALSRLRRISGKANQYASPFIEETGMLHAARWTAASLKKYNIISVHWQKRAEKSLNQPRQGNNSTSSMKRSGAGKMPSGLESWTLFCDCLKTKCFYLNDNCRKYGTFDIAEALTARVETPMAIATQSIHRICHRNSHRPSG